MIPDPIIFGSWISHNKRLVLAKAREWLVYANNSSRNPPFCYIKMRCTPDLGDKQSEEKFQAAVQKAYADARKTFIQNTIESLDQMIQEKTEEITSVRKNAVNEIGSSSKGAGDARKTLYRKLGELKDCKEKLPLVTAYFKWSVFLHKVKIKQANKSSCLSLNFFPSRLGHLLKKDQFYFQGSFPLK